MRDDAPLYDDIKAMDRVSRELVRRSSPDGAQPSALERGVREKPDGTRETYERIEFDTP
jgi:hypothetical protein